MYNAYFRLKELFGSGEAIVIYDDLSIRFWMLYAMPHISHKFTEPG
ncbi:hypothetical protein QE435_001631 [Rhizobium sp. SORGH_AS 787]|nr:hypothetical protein [Rhizobium sp. SORGH_AS_0787]